MKIYHILKLHKSSGLFLDFQFYPIDCQLIHIPEPNIEFLQPGNVF